MSVTLPTQKWLLLTHQLPDKPSNLRVRVWRRLQSIGAVPVKNSIYALPNRSSTREDFEWLRKEIIQSGGEASVFAGDSIIDSGDREIIDAFQKARAKDYLAFEEAVSAFNDKIKAALDGGHIKDRALEKFKRQWLAHQQEWERLGKIDFFKAPHRADAAAAMAVGQRHLNRATAVAVKESPAPPPPISGKDLRGRVWVTRRSPHVDRLATAWLVRRFVDGKAKFKFVNPPYPAKPNEIRFDMPEAEFTHFGDWCTFETLVHRLRLKDRTLDALAEIIHDIDLKDGKFARPEASGMALAVRAMCRAYSDDEDRVAAGIKFFEGAYAALGAEAKR